MVLDPTEARNMKKKNILIFFAKNKEEFHWSQIKRREITGQKQNSLKSMNSLSQSP